MDAIIEKVERAKNDNNEMDFLISEYLPFIRKTAGEAVYAGMEYDDRLSVAMLTFMNCVRQYSVERGNFITYAAVCIRNRLIDESRKQTGYSGKSVQIDRPLLTGDGDVTIKNSIVETDRASIEAYSREREREDLSDEIDAFSKHLIEFGISFDDLSRLCPRRQKARNQCVSLARYILKNNEIRVKLFAFRRLAQSEIAHEFNISEKTVEKHRKYIVALVILLSGDYPFIRAFLPQYKEVDL